MDAGSSVEISAGESLALRSPSFTKELLSRCPLRTFNPAAQRQLMEWHYASGDEQRGPVSDEEFQRLVSTGSINAQTLVWHDGMAEWLPYAQVQAVNVGVGETGGSDRISCAECGQSFPADEVIQISGAGVCGGCKSVFLQRIKEGVVLPGQLVYAGFWTRFGAKFVDGLILQIPFQVAQFGAAAALAETPETLSIALIVIALIYYPAWAAYTIVFIGKYGQTPGKMAMKIKVVTPEGGKVTYGQGAGRWGAEILSTIICWIGYIVAAFDEEKRSLHDRLAATRVVKIT